MTSSPADQWRIGVLASRVGVSETVLRAWETRYGLLKPARTATGYRLYGPEDERRAQAMVAARARGVPAAQAAAEVLASDRSAGDQQDLEDRGVAGIVPPPRTGEAAEAHEVEELRAAMLTYDSAAMHSVLDDALARLSVERVVRDVVLPFLRRVGDGWAHGTVDVADEHFATDIVRGRLAAMTFGAGASAGPLALLACPPEELHDIPLKAFEVVLQRAGWRTRYLGPNTPIASVTVAADIVEPDVVVLGGSRSEVFTDVAEEIAALGTAHRVCLAGDADATLAASLGARFLPGDPVTAASVLVRSQHAAR